MGSASISRSAWTMLGATSSSRPGARRTSVGGVVERVELAEHLAGEEAEERADLEAGDPRADRLGEPARRAASLLQLVDDRRR